jgi:hypothetical protein
MFYEASVVIVAVVLGWTYLARPALALEEVAAS